MFAQYPDVRTVKRIGELPERKSLNAEFTGMLLGGG